MFSFVWTTEWAHEGINLLKRADQPSHDLIEWMRRGGILNDSVLVFLSDHGLRRTGFAETEIGKHEGMGKMVNNGHDVQHRYLDEVSGGFAYIVVDQEDCDYADEETKDALVDIYESMADVECVLGNFGDS